MGDTEDACNGQIYIRGIVELRLLLSAVPPQAEMTEAIVMQHHTWPSHMIFP